MLNYMGTVSGRDEDKIAACGLHVEMVNSAPVFQESRMAIICRKLYAQPMEEACFLDQELIAKPKYALLRERFTTDVSKVHNGYFSQDKKGRLKDTKGDTQADDDTYNTIMRDKEWLLSFECPLRFIFSHSALREGWDNRISMSFTSWPTRAFPSLLPPSRKRSRTKLASSLVYSSSVCLLG